MEFQYKNVAINVSYQYISMGEEKQLKINAFHVKYRVETLRNS